MSRSTRLVTATLLILAAVLANVGFIVLGSIFNYPQILSKPATEIFDGFIANRAAIAASFGLLALAVGLLAPIALLVGRLSDARPMRYAVVAGVAAAIVQVIGLSRWPLLVPGFADRYATGGAAATQAIADLENANRILGNLIGETIGYILTASWTLLVVIAIGRTIGGRWFAVLGTVAAVMIAVGVLVPLKVPGATLVNFLGYVLWSIWLIVFAIILVRNRAGVASLTAPTS
jgi:Domain of unknown function (DUF4386)